MPPAAEPPATPAATSASRDYGNSPWHSLLDWRVSRDMLTLLSGDPIDVAREADWSKRLAERVAAETNLSVDYVGAVPILRRDAKALAVLHPLEDPSAQDQSSRIWQASESFPGVEASNLFELVRRPLAVAVRLL